MRWRVLGQACASARVAGPAAAVNNDPEQTAGSEVAAMNWIQSLGILLPLTLTACSPATEITRSWHDEAPQAVLSPLMVVGIDRDPQTRKETEAVMVSELARSGNSAMRSLAFIAGDEPLTLPTLLAAANRADASALIVIRLITQKVQLTEVPGRTGVKVNRGQESLADLFRNEYEEYEEPAYLTAESTLALATDFIRVADGRLLYSLDSVTTDKTSLREILAAASQAIVEQMRKDDLLL